jgi:hypothetical protein
MANVIPGPPQATISKRLPVIRVLKTIPPEQPFYSLALIQACHNLEVNVNAYAFDPFPRSRLADHMR